MNQTLKRIRAHAIEAKKITSRKDARYSKLQAIIELCDETDPLEGDYHHERS